MCNRTTSTIFIAPRSQQTKAEIRQCRGRDHPFGQPPARIRTSGIKSVSRYRRPQFCLPTISTTSAPRSSHRLRDGVSISRLNTWAARTPVNASPAPLRTPMHDSEPVWVASPSPYETFIHNTLPIFTGAPKSETNRGQNEFKIRKSKTVNSICLEHLSLFCFASF